MSSSRDPGVAPRVVLGISGGIAAYKAVELCRRLVDAGCHVVPVMTQAACRFIGVATLSALASEPARLDLFDGEDPIPHTRLGQDSDLVLVAPATAHLIASYAHGLSGDLLGATLIATRAPVVLCPAMHTEMWEHPSVQDNLAVLRRRGVHVVDPATGLLAGGDRGKGRLAEPDDILEVVARLLAQAGFAHLSGGDHPARADLGGLRFLVTAGGTREPIDPVRFLANRSSGRQGHALAEEAAARGAQVCLVTTVDRAGPAGAEIVRVDTAAEMQAEVAARSRGADVVVMAAAVADFRPSDPARSKLSKADGVPELRLEPTVDILEMLGRERRPGQILVGFAAETGDLVSRARAKLESKRLDLIVANDVTVPGAGFGYQTNSVVILGADGTRWDVGLADKRKVASAVIDAVVACIEGRTG